MASEYQLRLLHAGKKKKKKILLHRSSEREHSLNPQSCVTRALAILRLVEFLLLLRSLPGNNAYFKTLEIHGKKRRQRE